MKKTLLTFFALYFIFRLQASTYSQADTLSDFSYALIASKNGKERIYVPGNRLFIKYASDPAIKKVRVFLSV